MRINTQLIYHIKLKNFLSYGNEDYSLELRPLNVIIGANGTGKSNFLEAVRLLRLAPAPSGLLTAIRRAGGIDEVLWKGGIPEAAEIQIVTSSQKQAKLENGIGLLYRLKFTGELGHLKLLEEAVEEVSLANPFQPKNHSGIKSKKQPNGNTNGHKNGNGYNNGNSHANSKEFHYRFQKGVPSLNYQGVTTAGEREKRLRQVSMFKPTQTALSELKDPQAYPEISFLGNEFSHIAIYRGWKFTPGIPPRMPCLIEEKNDFLSENGRNLPLVLRELSRNEFVKAKIIANMQRFYNDFEDFFVQLDGNTAQLFIRERSFEKPIPSQRLSDGILRYLCLLAVLCHPQPPSLICLDEPEVGLHPEMMSTLTGLFLEATQKTQLIITTHSESLISALSVMPESLVVCERDEKGTRLQRVEVEKMSDVMSKYSLGKLWRLGTLGGTRRIW